MANFDVIVIGSGPGGYVAAIRAAQLGYKVAIIEKENLGGVCLNWGCIPTKALLKSAEVNNMLANLDKYGFKAPVKAEFDFAKIVERSRGVSAKLSAGIQHLMKKNKIKHFHNEAKLNGSGKVRLFKNGEYQEDITAKHIILATGARARVLKGLEPNGDYLWSYREALVPEELPKSIVIVGSGAIGVEFASFYNSFGSEVTIIELQDRILPVEDIEISKIAEKEFGKQGIKILKGHSVKSHKKKAGRVEVVITNHKDDTTITLKTDKILSAVGVVGNVENLGLDVSRVKVEKNQIIVDEFCRTDEDGIYAIGDVAGSPWLAHKASHEAVICVDHIKNPAETHKLNRKNIPGCTYSNPQIASIGLTEAQATEQGLNIKVGRFPFMANGKAIASSAESGLIKTIFDEGTGELLGAHMVGADVTEMISSFVIGKTMEATEADFMNSIFPHPTLSEMIHESVLDAFDKAIHI
ncbi:MAG: dihydrolipoyl dehydrogenase [Rickettsiales bacterium]|jgi:dihydrolipoamide dehydrogenase|nr:dihydrolipoyl dehydrogenase [Rickettsiales bacterium]